MILVIVAGWVLASGMVYAVQLQGRTAVRGAVLGLSALAGAGVAFSVATTIPQGVAAHRDFALALGGLVFTLVAEAQMIVARHFRL